MLIRKLRNEASDSFRSCGKCEIKFAWKERPCRVYSIHGLAVEVRVPLGGPILTIGRTVFEMWLGAL